MAKHSAGQWYPTQFANMWDLKDGPFYNAKSLLDCHDVGEEKAEANANLMAAAPVMLLALEAVNNYFIALQNKCALTGRDERAWKLAAGAIKLATDG